MRKANKTIIIGGGFAEMVKSGQIRSFADGSALPNIKVNHFNEDTNKWACVFQEDFRYPYISLTEKQIEEETELLSE